MSNRLSFAFYDSKRALAHIVKPRIFKYIALFALMCVSLPVVKADEAFIPPEGPVIGIDLGTTYSCVGVYQDGRVQIISNDQGNRITPSYVAFTEEGEILVGDSAKNQASSNPLNTVFDAKRFIGRLYSDKEVKKDMKLIPFQVVNSKNKPGFRLPYHPDKVFLAEEVSAMVLQKMKDIAQQYLSTNVSDAVITVPAYFNDAQRQATKDAGAIAGLNVRRIISEPTAAAIAYGLDKKNSDENILVYDLGGGTFDVSVLTLDEDVFEVLATSGDTHLGGEDFDARIVSYLVKRVKKLLKKDVSKSPRALATLRREAERVKRTLSTAQTARIEIDSLFDGLDYTDTLSRAKFQELNKDLFKKTLKPVREVLKKAELKKSEIHEIVLVGGSTRIPMIQKMISDYFNGKDLNRGVDPDEAVAYGAAILGGSIAGETGKASDILVLDVTPMSLGIETMGGVMTTLIQRDSVIPAQKSQVFSTSTDNQPSVKIKVFQGERALTKDNLFLGEFELGGIPPAPRGVPQIEVTFTLDSDGILSVNAQDKATQASNSVTITEAQGRLSKEDIERLLSDAAKYKDQDEKIKADINARNELEGLAFNLKSQISESGPLASKISQHEREEILEAVDSALSFLDSNPLANAEDCDEKKAELEAISNPIVQRAYQQGQGTYQTDEDEYDDEDDLPEHDDL
ncbi:hypothetical protein AAMO2058_001209900 [Amorphochlora amoebiformis]